MLLREGNQLNPWTRTLSNQEISQLTFDSGLYMHGHSHTYTNLYAHGNKGTCMHVQKIHNNKNSHALFLISENLGAKVKTFDASNEFWPCRQSMRDTQFYSGDEEVGQTQEFSAITET